MGGEFGEEGVGQLYRPNALDERGGLRGQRARGQKTRGTESRRLRGAKRVADLFSSLVFWSLLQDAREGIEDLRAEAGGAFGDGDAVVVVFENGDAKWELADASAEFAQAVA